MNYKIIRPISGILYIVAMIILASGLVAEDGFIGGAIFGAILIFSVILILALISDLQQEMMR